MRLLKQILYGGIFLIIIVLVVWWLVGLIYTPSPTCFDNSQNQGEEGVDCGGPCISCEIKSLKPITIQNKFIIPLENEAGVVIELINPNTEWAAKSFDYTLIFKDQFGSVVQSITGNSFIYAGEFKDIILPRISASSTTVATVDITIQNPQWEQKEIFRKPEVEIQEFGTSYEKGIVVSTKINNKDTQSLINVDVAALVFNRSGVLIGASKTRIDSLPAFESKQVRIIFPKNLDLYQPTIAPAISFSRVLIQGDTGEDVGDLQMVLKEQGLYAGVTTKFFDADTQAAVREFQQKNKLEVTGMLDETTRIFINKLLTDNTPQQNTQVKDTSVDASRTKVFVEVSR